MKKIKSKTSGMLSVVTEWSSVLTILLSLFGPIIFAVEGARIIGPDSVIKWIFAIILGIVLFVAFYILAGSATSVYLVVGSILMIIHSVREALCAGMTFWTYVIIVLSVIFIVCSIIYLCAWAILIREEEERLRSGNDDEEDYEV